MVSQMLRRLPWLVGVVLIAAASQAQAQYPGAPPAGYAPGALPGQVPNFGPGYGPGYRPGFGVAPTAYYLQDGTVVQGVPEGAPLEPQPMPGEGYYEEGEYAGEGYDEGYAEGFGGRGLDGSLLGLILPYAEGGLAAPRWFDVRVSGVQLAREKASRTIDFSSAGIAPVNGDPNVVLSSNNLDFDDEWGARVVVQRQIGPGSNIEFNFLGSFNYNAFSQVYDQQNGLFSAMSDFGRSPPFGFVETDFAAFHGIAYSSAFNSYELLYRRRWEGRTERFQGSYTAGVRYLQLTEDFDYQTRALGVFNPQQIPGPYYMDYSVGTNNSLTGFQFGGDAWLTIIPGLRLGAEGKAGIYGNHSRQNTVIYATSIPAGYFENMKSDDAAFIGEVNFSVIYRINYHWTLRGGYDLLYLDGLSLAIENFNASPPFVNDPTLRPDRVPTLNDNGSIFYHGWNIGLEYMW